MTTELHLTYLCVPVTETLAQLDWKRFEAMLSTLTVRQRYRRAGCSTTRGAQYPPSVEASALCMLVRHHMQLNPAGPPGLPSPNASLPGPCRPQRPLWPPRWASTAAS